MWLLNLLQKHRAVAFAVYGLVAISNVIGVRSVLMVIAHTTVLCTVACFTASPLFVWIISILFLLSFNISSTQTLMVSDALHSNKYTYWQNVKHYYLSQRISVFASVNWLLAMFVCYVCLLLQYVELLQMLWMNIVKFLEGADFRTRNRLVN